MLEKWKSKIGGVGGKTRKRKKIRHTNWAKNLQFSKQWPAKRFDEGQKARGGGGESLCKGRQGQNFIGDFFGKPRTFKLKSNVLRKSRSEIPK